MDLYKNGKPSVAYIMTCLVFPGSVLSGCDLFKLPWGFYSHDETC